MRERIDHHELLGQLVMRQVRRAEGLQIVNDGAAAASRDHERDADLASRQLSGPRSRRYRMGGEDGLGFDRVLL